MATYILKAFDKDKAASGFRCIMLTGNYFEGNVVEDSTEGIKGVGVATLVNYYTFRLEIGGTLYSFNSKGVCQTQGNTNYRLMLIEGYKENPSGNLAEVVEALNTLNSTIESYLSQTEGMLENLDERVKALEK